mmetsp:Transcript_33006/g.105177  ORF Transcript_33006/g.105177 Transcript_33006/m.105177 type:complete len:209 (+) Transcript_33006:141-767(+)
MFESPLDRTASFESLESEAELSQQPQAPLLSRVNTAGCGRAGYDPAAASASAPPTATRQASTPLETRSGRGHAGRTRAGGSCGRRGTGLSPRAPSRCCCRLCSAPPAGSRSRCSTAPCSRRRCRAGSRRGARSARRKAHQTRAGRCRAPASTGSPPRPAESCPPRAPRSGARRRGGRRLRGAGGGRRPQPRPPRWPCTASSSRSGAAA